MLSEVNQIEGRVELLNGERERERIWGRRDFTPLVILLPNINPPLVFYIYIDKRGKTRELTTTIWYWINDVRLWARISSQWSPSATWKKNAFSLPRKNRVVDFFFLSDYFTPSVYVCVFLAIVLPLFFLPFKKKPSCRLWCQLEQGCLVWNLGPFKSLVSFSFLNVLPIVDADGEQGMWMYLNLRRRRRRKTATRRSCEGEKRWSWNAREKTKKKKKRFHKNEKLRKWVWGTISKGGGSFFDRRYWRED